MLNIYGPGLAILFVVFVEAAGVCWIYGTDNFARDIEKMIGFRPGIFWRICWKYISPVFILVSSLHKCNMRKNTYVDLTASFFSDNFRFFTGQPRANAWYRIPLS